MEENKLVLAANNPEYDALLQHVGDTQEKGRKSVVNAVNSLMVRTYWEIGRQIVEYEQHGNEKAEYGSDVLNRLSRDLTDRYGKGFDPLERAFYKKEAENEHWGVRELKRQMKSMLFHRLALSTDKQEVMRLAREGQIVERPEDILKEPYVFEFTGLPQLPVYDEGDLEEALVNNLSLFFLELGKGFTYVGRQQKVVIGGRTYKVDLVFYHRILKCFVLIDLKRGEVQHEDIGQMNFYLNYYREEMNTEGDTEPIGIVMGAYQDKLVMHYALQNITNQVFVSRYQLYLPDRDQLEAEFHRFMSMQKDDE